MDGKYWAKVSKRGITERERAKIKNPYLMSIYISISIHIFIFKKILQAVYEE